MCTAVLSMTAPTIQARLRLSSHQKRSCTNGNLCDFAYLQDRAALQACVVLLRSDCRIDECEEVHSCVASVIGLESFVQAASADQRCSCCYPAQCMICSARATCCI